MRVLSLLPPITENPELDWDNVSLGDSGKAAAEPEVSAEMLAAAADAVDSAALGTHALNMYWFDIYEDALNQPGQLYVFGKTVDPEKKKTVSCCVHVRNMERCMFVLPRAFRVTDPRAPEATRTAEPVEMAHVHAELSAICEKLGIERVRDRSMRGGRSDSRHAWRRYWRRQRPRRGRGRRARQRRQRQDR